MILTLIKWIFIACLIGLFLFIFSADFRNWVLLKIVERATRRMQDQMGGFREEGDRRQKTSSRAKTHHHEKVPLDDIEARRFQKGQNDEYVDFEELP